MTSGGSWTNTQYVGESVDPTGLTFTVTYGDGTAPALVSPQAHTPTTWGETAGTQTCTFTYTEGDESVSCAVEATVAEPVAPVLESLSVTGSFTNAQYKGQAPDLTGLTFTAGYSDGNTETVSASDIVCTPALWSAEGNPDNLGTQDVVFSFTKDDVTVTTGINGTVIHWPSNPTLDMDTAGWVYIDMPQEMLSLLNAHSGSKWGPAGMFQGNTAQVGDLAFFVFDESSYENDTPVTAQVLGGWMATYGLGSQGETFAETGTPNTAGFVPAYGVNNHSTLDESYVCVRTDGTATMSAGTETVYLLFGTLGTALDGTSYKKSDLDTTQTVWTYEVQMEKS